MDHLAIDSPIAGMCVAPVKNVKTPLGCRVIVVFASSSVTIVLVDRLAGNRIDTLHIHTMYMYSK